MHLPVKNEQFLSNLAMNEMANLAILISCQAATAR